MDKAISNLVDELKSFEETKNKGDINKDDEHDDILGDVVKYHLLSFKELKDTLKTNLDLGLTEEEAASRLEKNGLNMLKVIKDTSYSAQMLTKFIHWLPFFGLTVLIFAFFDVFILQILLSDYYDQKSVYFGIFSIYIVFVITPELFKDPVNTDIVKVLKLNYLIPHEAGVIRNGAINVIQSAKVVKGDLLLLEKDDIVPADIRLTFSNNLKTRRPNCDEIITHTAEVSLKSVSPHKNLVFYGHKVEDGSAMGVVIATGLNTQIGAINETVYKMQEPVPISEYIKGVIFFVLVAAVIVGLCYLTALGFDMLVFAFLKHFSTKYDLSPSTKYDDD